jgi:AcrR family transcriptional regulator
MTMSVQGLSREQILEKALAFVDENGLEALSMRRLGAALGVEAMSLYHHVPNKGALLDGLVETVLARVPLPDPASGDWKAALKQGFQDFRRVMLEHPGVFPVVASRPVMTREGLIPIAMGFAVLGTAGFTPRQTVSAWSALLDFVMGYILGEITGAASTCRGAGPAQALIGGLGDEFGPMRAAWAAAGDWNDDAEFEWGLDALLDGLARKAGAETADGVAK